MKNRLIFCFILAISIITFVSAVPKDLSGPLYHEINYTNIIMNGTVNHSNSTDNWNTGDRGPLRNVADILHSWLDATSLLWSNAGHTIDTDLETNGNSIIELDKLGFDGGQNITWNANDYTINVPTGLGPVNQVGQEDYEIVFNTLGTTAENGRVIYWDSNENDRPTIGLAYSRDQTISEKTIGFLTMDITNGTEGIAVSRGRIRDINTSMGSIGDTVYLDPTEAGEWTINRPTQGDFIIILGMICKVGITDGEICARNSQLLDPNDLNAATGFPNQNAILKESDAVFYNINRSFELSPNVAAGYNTFYIWQLGTKYLFNDTQDVQIPNEEGSFYVYFDEGNLTYIKNPSDGQVGNLIREKVSVSIVYWNADDNEAVIIGDERHGHIMSSDTHAFLHFTKGAQWLNGLALGDFIIDDSGNDDEDAQFSIGSGVITDEDLINIISAINSTTGVPIFYLNGSQGDLRRYSEPGFNVLTDITAGVGVTGRLVWNNPDSGGIGVWGLDTVANTDFVLAHIFSTNSKIDPVVSFVGQGDYPTISAARAGAEVEISTIITSYPGPELVPLGTVIFQTRNSYSNSVKSRTRTTDIGDTYVDWRTSELQPGTAPAAHPNLASLSWIGSGHSGTADTIAGFNGLGTATEYNESDYVTYENNDQDLDLGLKSLYFDSINPSPIASYDWWFDPISYGFALKSQKDGDSEIIRLGWTNTGGLTINDDVDINGNLDLHSGNLTTTGTVNATTIDLGTNTIYGGNMTGNWAMNDGEITGVSKMAFGSNDRMEFNGDFGIYQNAGASEWLYHDESESQVRFNFNFVPRTDDQWDIGASGLELDDLRVDGVGYIDSISTDSLGYIYAYSGIRIGSSSPSKEIDDASQGSLSSTLYIGNKAIVTTSSDERLKKNIKPTKAKGVEFVKDLKDLMVDYEWKSEEEDDYTHLGMTAQSLNEKYPEYVMKPDYFNETAYINELLIDNENKTLEQATLEAQEKKLRIENSTWAINYPEMVPRLIISTQEYIKAGEPVDIGDNKTALKGDVALYEQFVTQTPKFFTSFEERKPAYQTIITAHQEGNLRNAEGKIKQQYIPNECQFYIGENYTGYTVECLSEYYIELLLDNSHYSYQMFQEQKERDACWDLPLNQVQNCMRAIG
jgi:hypothetical protein